MTPRRTEAINFRDFIKNDWRKKKVSSPVILNSSAITILSWSSLFSPPTMIAKGYLLMIGIGITVIALAYLEKRLGVNGHVKLARTIFNFIQIVMPFALIGALIMFVYLNPLL